MADRDISWGRRERGGGGEGTKLLDCTITAMGIIQHSTNKICTRTDRRESIFATYLIRSLSAPVRPVGHSTSVRELISLLHNEFNN